MARIALSALLILYYLIMTLALVLAIQYGTRGREESSHVSLAILAAAFLAAVKLSAALSRSQDAVAAVGNA